MPPTSVTAACADSLADYLGKIRSCVDRLSEAQIWWRPSPSCNSVGNLLLHLCGNLSQWVLAALGGEPYDRRRSEEFAADGTAGGGELIRRLEAVVQRCEKVIRGLSDEDLRRPCHVQGQDTDGLGVALHVVEHMSYHTGQIVFVAKQLLGDSEEIEFYAHLRGT